MLSMHDTQLLASVPDFLSIGSMLKATPSTEGGRRFVFFEASNEGLDQQNEVVAAKALADSADYFCKYGNIDIDHFTLIGAKAGIPDYTTYEIGRPVEVRQNGAATFVKAEIYSGNGKAAIKANDFWSSLTEINPPARWYPSVGGSVLEKAIEIDPSTKMRKAIIKKVRWNNIGVSKTPVNQHVPTCGTVPVGAFAKSLTASGSGWDWAKALEAGYGTDSATLSGGGALRIQSLQGIPMNYYDFKERLAGDMVGGKLEGHPIARDLLAYACENFSLALDEAAEWVERFLRDIENGLTQRR